MTPGVRGCTCNVGASSNGGATSNLAIAAPDPVHRAALRARLDPGDDRRAVHTQDLPELATGLGSPVETRA